jgi:hypothetical protein
MRRRLPAFVPFGLACLAVAAAAPAPAAGAAAPHVGPYHEVFAPDGSIAMLRGTVRDTPPRPSVPAQAPTVTTVLNSGRANNRYNLVFVGDGYTQGEMSTYAQNVSDLLNRTILTTQPFATYRTYFNAYRVDVASPVSGISNDPTDGITRSTPLAMRFYCFGLARLLCVSFERADAYAAYAPGHDNVIALANTTTYGGSGGLVTTVAGRNASAGGIVVHEMGHSIGGLGDEYDTPFDRASGVEPTYPNVTAYLEAQMRQARTKWWRWLGAATPDGGTVGVFEGASQFHFGLFRPSVNSLMHTLGQRFNLPSAEALVEALYRKVRPVDQATSTAITLGRTSQVTVVPMQPVGTSLQVTWRLDGRTVATASGQSTLDLSRVTMTAGRHTLTATVVDPTTFVRDEAFRAQYMTQTVTWAVSA